MHGYSLMLGIYLLVLLVVCLQVIFATRSSTKAMAYLLFCVFAPVIGILFYVLFGINYWRKKLYTRKLDQDETTLRQLKSNIDYYNRAMLTRKDSSVQDNAELINLLIKDLNSPLTAGNTLKILVNGEEKFPELLACMEAAQHHIHIEYYIYEQDEIGTRIIELLIKKAKQGVEVRFIYDDFGSPGIKKEIGKAHAGCRYRSLPLL